MDIQHNKGSLASNLIAALCGNLATDVVLRLTGLKEAASLVSEAVDVTTITQQISFLMI